MEETENGSATPTKKDVRITLRIVLDTALESMSERIIEGFLAVDLDPYLHKLQTLISQICIQL